MKPRILHLRAAVLLALAGCATLPSVDYFLLDVRVRPPQTVWSHENAASSWGVGAHPFVKRVSDRRIVLTYWIAGDGASAGHAGSAWPRFSDDGGSTWMEGDPFQWSAGRPPTNLLTCLAQGQVFRDFDLGVFFGEAQQRDGSRLLRGHMPSGPSLTAPAITVRADGSDPTVTSLAYELPADRFDSPRLNVENSSVLMPDGRIFTVAYGGSPVRGKLESWLFSLSPGEATCRFVSVVGAPADAPWGGDGPCEPALVRLNDGTLLSVMRTGMASGYDPSGKANRASPMLAARSVDEGRTWTHERLPYPGVMPKLVLMRNGVLAMAFGRPGNSVVFSLDGGRTWSREVTLSPPGLGTTGYCDIVEVGDNRLLAVYDRMDYRSRSVWLWDPPPAVNALLTRIIEVRPRR